MTRSKTRALGIVEAVLFAIGSIAGAWCLVVLLTAQYYARLPIPPPPPPGSDPLAADAAGARGEAARRQPGDWIARLDAPTLGMSVPILEGTDDQVLLKGAGHIGETPMPGQPGNIGIAGHRDTIFRPLRKVHSGDELMLTTVDRVFRYRVAGTSVVQSADVWVLDATDQPALTLVTCYPFSFIGRAPQRFIVRAYLLSEEPRLTAVAR